MPPPPLAPFLLLSPPKSVIPTALWCLSLASSLQGSIPPYNGNPQGSIRSWGSSPRFLIQKKCRLHHRLEVGSGGPCVVPLPPQNLGEPRPLIPCPYNFVHHLWPVIVGCGKNPTRVLTVGHRLQWMPIGLKGRIRGCVGLFLYLPPDILLHTLGTYRRFQVSPVQWLP